MADTTFSRETRDVSGFSSVALGGLGKLRITQGDEERLSIEAAPEMLEKIKAEVKDGELRLSLRKGSLLALLDLTFTPMGARLLRQRLLFPLQDRDKIQLRLAGVEMLLADAVLRRDLKEQLDGIYDIERLCSRLVLGHGNARDMAALKASLGCLPELKKLLMNTPNGGLLQDIGCLPLLDWLKNNHDSSEDLEAEYNKLTDRYASRIGELMLRNWQFDEELIDVVKSRADWSRSSAADVDIADIVTIARHHQHMAKGELKAEADDLRVGAYDRVDDIWR